jgi:hypothetical protein
LGRCIQDEYDAALPRIRNTINEIPGLAALTRDCWSSRVFRSYFVVTIHWISTTFDMQRLVLEFLHFPPPHDQHNTMDILLNIINNYKLGLHVRAVTTDRGSEMPPAIQQVRQYLNEQFSLDFGNDFHIRCGCHIIDRAVKDSSVHMRAQLQKLRALLKVIRLSNTIRQKFKNAQVRLGRLHLRDVPSLVVDTRWSSSFLMIKSSFEMKDVLEAICNDNTLNLGENALDEEDWKVLKTVSTFLETAAEITTLLSGSGYATLSLQPLIFKKLVKHCEKTLSDVSACREVRSASVSFKAKMMKCEQNLASDLALLALGNKGDWVNDMKSRVRTVLSSKYGVGLNSQTSVKRVGYGIGV